MGDLNDLAGSPLRMKIEDLIGTHRKAERTDSLKVEGPSTKTKKVQSSATFETWALNLGPSLVGGWQRPTLPCPLKHSTIGADRLNCRVRNGIGCGPVALVTSHDHGETGNRRTG